MSDVEFASTNFMREYPLYAAFIILPCAAKGDIMLLRKKHGSVEVAT